MGGMEMGGMGVMPDFGGMGGMGAGTILHRAVSQPVSPSQHCFLYLSWLDVTASF
jgi:hypothetical protein